MTDRSDLIIAGKLNADLGFWIGPHRAWARASVQREPFHDVHVGSSLPVKGSSVLDPQSTVVTVRAGSRPGLEEYGSFPSDAQPCLVMVQVKGFAAGSDPDDQTVRGRRCAALPHDIRERRTVLAFGVGGSRTDGHRRRTQPRPAPSERRRTVGKSRGSLCTAGPSPLPCPLGRSSTSAAAHAIRRAGAR